MPDTGLAAQPGTGKAPQPGTGKAPQPGAGEAPQPGTGEAPLPGTGKAPQPGTGEAPLPAIGEALPPGGDAHPPETGHAHLPESGYTTPTASGQAVPPGTGRAVPPRTGETPEPSHAILTLPNVISFARLCVVPLAIWLVLHQSFAAAFACFVAAGISDAIDGWLARRHGGTVLGAALDPLADKALMIGMFVTLAATAQLPDWLAILVVFRDLVIVGGVALLWVTSHPVAIRPLRISKLNTGLQIGLVALVLGLNALGLALPTLRWAAIVLVTASTLASGSAYVVRTARPA